MACHCGQFRTVAERKLKSCYSTIYALKTFKLPKGRPIQHYICISGAFVPQLTQVYSRAVIDNNGITMRMIAICRVSLFL